MASKFWKSGATAVQQVDRLTLGGTWEANDVLTITLKSADEVGSQTLTVVAGSTVIATIVATVRAAFNVAATGGDPAYSYFAGITASDGSSWVTLTADTAGVPFYCTVTTTENGGGGADSQTFVRSSITPNSGPYDLNCVANLSDGVALANGDTLYVDARGGSNSILYGLNQSAVTLAVLDVNLGFTGNAGSLDTTLRISASLFRYGAKPSDGSSPSGSQLFRIDLGTNAAVVLVDGTRNTGTSGQPALMIKGTHASNTLTVQGNSFVGVGVAVPGESTTLAALSCKGSGQVTCGTGVTLTNVTNTGAGKIVTNSAISGTLKNTAGTVITYGNVLIATIDAQGGSLFLNHRKSSGDSITTLQMNGGTVDFQQDDRTLTVNALSWAGGKILQSASNQVTYTGITLVFTESKAGTYSVPE